ncbi:MAG: hypothetical protein MI924_31260, partial [Chloroflexales bacterium]|nr:hypothetical protein [Chloroflexales bacterium]
MPFLRQRAYYRLFFMGFTACLAVLLFTWNYRSWAATASLTVNSTTASQDDTVTLVGQGFSPNETVSVWVTDPNYRVFKVTEVKANEKGEFSYSHVPDFEGKGFVPTGKYIYTARGQLSGHEVHSSVQVNTSKAPGASAEVKLTAQQGSDNQGNYVMVRGANYGAREVLAIWLRYPDHTGKDLGYIDADQSGNFEYMLRLDGAPVGRYAFTARGLNTTFNGIVEFNIKASDLTKSKGSANLSVRSTSNKQRNDIIFEGSGFQAGEVVSIWITLPDFSTTPLGDVRVDKNGTFIASLYISERVPVGKHTFTAFGNTSKLRAVADFTLRSGASSPPQAPDVGAPPAPQAPDA